MTNYNELLQKISSVNAQVQTLNKERQVNLGKKQALETQLSNAIANYKASYGVDLTPETVEAEYNKVLAEKQAEVAKLETTLSAIKQGNFAEVENVMGIAPQAEVPQTEPIPQAQVTPQAVVPQQVEMPQPAPQVVSAPAPAPQVETSQSAPSVTVPISQAVAPAPQVVAPTAPAMTPVSDTPVSAPPLNFNSILAGTDFQ